MAKEEQIKTSIDLTGEKEYRAACTNINSSLREIGSEMKLTTAEFADNAEQRGSADRKTEAITKAVRRTGEESRSGGKGIEENAR